MPLVSLKQIEGGKQLRSDVNLLLPLLQSYDAAKVLTSISKPEGPLGEDNGEYNVDELLESLKSTLDTVVNGGDGLSLQSLSDAINGLKNKTIKDPVRVVGTATYNGGYEIDFGSNFNIANRAPLFDTTTELPVFYENNRPVLDSNGNQITFDFFSGEFSGTPSEIDEENSDLDNDILAYKSLNSDFTFKVFPVGQFTLDNIPSEFLLDNLEVQLLAYDQVLNKIIVELAKNGDIVDAIVNKVGEETVANQIAAITDALAQRVTALETNSVTVNDIATVIRNQETAENSKVASEKAVIDAIIANDSKTQLQSLIQQQSDRISAIETVIAPHEEVFPITGATQDTETVTFNLALAPNSQVVKMLVNHLVYTEDEDFTVNRNTKVVTWLLGERGENGFKITPAITDSVRIMYHAGSLVQNSSLTTIIHADAIPLTGTYKVGDMVIRTTPLPTKNLGWICSEAGSPGTWTEFGIVDFKNTIYPVESAGS